MLKSLFCALAGGLLLGSCNGARIVTAKDRLSGPDTSYFCGLAQGFFWKKVSNTVASGAVKTPSLLPTEYQVFEVSGAGAFFDRAKRGTQEVFVPLPAGCIPFKTALSGTMSEGLRKKYPQLVSLSGSNGAGDDLRLDWNGTTFSGQVLTAAGGKTYLIERNEAMPANTYFIYDKEASRAQKQPFENSPNSTRQASPADLQMTAPPPADR